MRRKKASSQEIHTETVTESRFAVK